MLQKCKLLSREHWKTFEVIKLAALCGRNLSKYDMAHLNTLYRVDAQR